MFSLVSARYERASLIVTSNKPFSAWGEIFGDEIHRGRDDRPARPSRRDPLPQGRLLPPPRQRPRRPKPRKESQIRLTDHPRRPRRGPQNAPTRPDLARPGPPNGPRA